MVKVKAKKKGRIFFGRRKHEFKEGDEFDIPDEYGDRLQHPLISQYLKLATEIDDKEKIILLEKTIEKLQKRIEKLEKKFKVKI